MAHISLITALVLLGSSVRRSVYFTAVRAMIPTLLFPAGSLLSLLAVKDVFETVRPLLVREKIIGEDVMDVRIDNLKALGMILPLTANMFACACRRSTIHVSSSPRSPQVPAP